MRRLAPLSFALALWLSASPALAAPKKPTAEEAIAAAAAWHAKLIEDDAKSRAEAALATSPSFFSAAYDATGESVCSSSTATTPEALEKALECLSKQLPASAELVAWTKKDGKALKGPLGAAHGKRLVSWAKTATIVHQHVPCVGEGQDLILVVAWEGAKDQPAAPSKGKPELRVVAAMNQKIICGE